VFTKLARYLLSDGLLDLGFVLVFAALWIRKDRRKSDRFVLLRGPFLVMAKSRGFLLAKPFSETIPMQGGQLSERNRRETAIARHGVLKREIDKMIKESLAEVSRRKS
jgi:hypothetical protein